MTALLIIIFMITLLYLALSVNIKSYITLISLQGGILFLVAISSLHHFDIVHLVLILLETLIFKAFAFPYILYKISKQHNVKNLKSGKTHRKTKGFFLVILTSFVLAASFVFSYYLHDEHLEIKFFTAAISAIILGMVFIIVNRNLVSHLISFLIIENGIFLLALAVGSEMPMMVNSAILLDIFATVLVLGTFLTRIGVHYYDIEADELTQLKD